MKNHSKQKVLWTLCLACLLIIPVTSIAAPIKKIQQTIDTMSGEDLNPLVDEIIITVSINSIRSLEKTQPQTNVFKKIDLLTNPDFYTVVFINNEKFKSTVWRNQKYVDDPQWSATAVVPKDIDFVNITIQLWDWNLGLDQRCDISSNFENYRKSFEAQITYSVKTGIWWGDDYNGDLSGYGRLNGCDDGSIDQKELDCELWFDITQNDFDNDSIPYWAEVNVFGTDPAVNDRGTDLDGDVVPYEWEYKWGGGVSYDWEENMSYYWIYDPFTWENHSAFDPENDGLTNIQEYYTSQWKSDPFRRDLFVELDQMEPSPDGQQNILPDGSKELIRNAFDSHNIVFHLDDGAMGGSEMIPFQETVGYEELQAIYLNYFLHGNASNWRRGVFHYGLVVYNATYHGFVFWGGVGPYLDTWQISTKTIEQKKVIPKIQHKRDIAFASAYMHECGHTLGLFGGLIPGIDDQNGKFPWQHNWWVWKPYKSIMNYRYMYQMVDYSDGSRGKNDFDDWHNLDLTFFNTPLWDE